jgi:hypothetical protein
MFIKKVFLIAVAIALFAAPSQAVKWQDLDADFGIQYRVMYNNSNIGAEDGYDFFRQRLRLNIDVHTEDRVGGFLQIEYRGGWGGASPAGSDPRDSYTINMNNRLQARGLRYGYVYFPIGPGQFKAGLVPLDDQFDQMIFSADWDFNVGGLTYDGKAGQWDWRASYVRLVEGVANRNTPIEDSNLDLIVLDANVDIGKHNIGGHIYALTGEVVDPGIGDYVDANQSWGGAHANLNLGPVFLRVLGIANSGEFDDTDTDGTLFRAEASIPVQAFKFSALGVYSSGEDDGTGFQTIQGIFGLGGYWNYTHIFSPNGPSDVNDYGFEAGNRGFGLTTIQGKADWKISDKAAAYVYAAYFQSAEDMDAAAGGADVGKDLGTEYGIQFAINLGKSMNLEVGYAAATLDDAGVVYQGNDEDSIYEFFSRLQLEF